MEKQSIKRGSKRMTEKQLAANRRNASMAGRPAGSMNADKLAFRDRFRAKEVELADNLINLALHGKTEQIRLAATERCIDRGWGRPPQPHDGDGQGGPMTLIGPINFLASDSRSPRPPENRCVRRCLDIAPRRA